MFEIVFYVYILEFRGGIMSRSTKNMQGRTVNSSDLVSSLQRIDAVASMTTRRRALTIWMKVSTGKKRRGARVWLDANKETVWLVGRHMQLEGRGVSHRSWAANGDIVRAVQCPFACHSR